MQIFHEWLLRIIHAILVILFALGFVAGLQALIFPDWLTFTYFLYAGGLAGLPWSILGSFLPDSLGFQVLQTVIYWAAALFNYALVLRALRRIRRSKHDTKHKL